MTRKPYITPQAASALRAAINEPAVLTTKQAAAYLGVAVATLRTWRHRRRGPKSFRMEGRIVYRRSALDAYLDACESADSRSNESLNPLNRPPEVRRGRSSGRPAGERDAA